MIDASFVHAFMLLSITVGMKEACPNFNSRKKEHIREFVERN